MCNKSAMDQEQKERYARWQDYRIKQLSFSINLFLGFAVVSLGYAINLKLGEDPRLMAPLSEIIGWWGASAALGCLATVSRLLDYRHTAQKIKEGGYFNTFMAKWCGPVTWGSFWVQLIAYVVGAYKFLFGIVST